MARRDDEHPSIARASTSPSPSARPPGPGTADERLADSAKLNQVPEGHRNSGQTSRRGALATLAGCAGFGLYPRLLHASDGDRVPKKIDIDLPQLRYTGNWSPRPNVMREVAREVRMRTRVEPRHEPRFISADDKALFDTPFLYVAGRGSLPNFSRSQQQRLRQFVDFGGLLVFDDADGGSGRQFRDDVSHLIRDLMPGTQLRRVSPEHVLFRSFYIVRSPSGRTRSEQNVFGVQREGRLRVLYIANDLGGALARNSAGDYIHPCTPGGERQRASAIHFAINIVLYATCTDYKADPAHVETLLRSRRWR